jgi:hypothetical protein
VNDRRLISQHWQYSVPAAAVHNSAQPKPEDCARAHRTRFCASIDGCTGKLLLQAGAAGESDRVHLSMCGDVSVSEYRILGLRQRFVVAIYNNRPEWPIPVLRRPVRKLCSVA